MKRLIKTKKRPRLTLFHLTFLFALCTVLCAALPARAADTEPPEMKRWVRQNNFSDKGGNQRLRIKVVYYANEYVEALVNSEAEKNLWTQDEMENYKYTLLRTLNLHDSIAFHMDLYVEGLPLYPAPFDRHLTLIVGKNRYSPSDYDKRFNFKILGARDGMVLFPRYDPKTGEDVLKGAKDIRLIFDSAISQAITARGDVTWVWDITKDRPGALGDGKAMDRLEIDRLIKRLDKLNSDRKELQTRLDAIDSELNQVNSRIDELQTR